MCIHERVSPGLILRPRLSEFYFCPRMAFICIFITKKEAILKIYKKKKNEIDNNKSDPCFLRDLF